MSKTKTEVREVEVEVTTKKVVVGRVKIEVPVGAGDNLIEALIWHDFLDHTQIKPSKQWSNLEAENGIWEERSDMDVREVVR